MTNFIKNLLGFSKPSVPSNGGLSSFLNGSSREKAKLIRKVLREANEDQRRLIRQYAGE